MAINPGNEILVVNITLLKVEYIYLFYKVQLAQLLTDETHTIIFPKYANFVNVSLSNNVIELFNHKNINNQHIKLIGCQQLFYKLIYYLWPVEVEILRLILRLTWLTSL